jgi:hypothetical protein
VLRKVLILCALSALLAGCGAQSRSLGPAVYEINRMPVEDVWRVLAGKTIMTFVDAYQDCSYNMVGNYVVPSCHAIPGPGTQVEFLAEDGWSYLWYPGNRGPVRGQWTLHQWYREYAVCFRYGAATLKPFTKDPRDTFDCTLLTEYAPTVTETAEGDPFDLSSGRLPFVLVRDQTTIDALLKRRAAR